MPCVSGGVGDGLRPPTHSTGVIGTSIQEK